MKLSRVLSVVLLSGVLTGCSGTPRHANETPAPTMKQGTSLLVIYSGSSNTMAAGERREDPWWVGSAVEISDPAYDLGYMNDRDRFLAVTDKGEGSLSALGGSVLKLALREHETEAVYPLGSYGTLKLQGMPILPEKSVKPRVADPYFPEAVIDFHLPGSRDVHVRITAPPPNGFSIP